MTRRDRNNDPHDRLVRHTLSIPENVVPLLRAVLTPELITRLDLASLALEPGSFVDRDGESRTDLLFSARLGERGTLVYVLLEHQSRPDPDMPLRVLRYMVRIWSAWREQHGSDRLPPIVPVVLHHRPRGWTAPRRLVELLDVDETTHALLAPCIPDFELLIDDLARVPEADLLARQGAALGKLVVWVLRAARVGFDPALTPKWADELGRAAATGSDEALLHVLQYLVGTDEGAAVFEALQQGPLPERVREVVMKSYQQRWIEEGEAKGRAEGEAKGKAELLLRQLRLRFVDVPDATEQRVRGASVEDLDRWAERVLFADALDRVFA